MAVSVVMPALEMAQETGKLVRWLKQEGETVRKGDMLLEIETDKAVVEVEAQGDGVLAAVTARVDDVIPVGQTIAWLVAPGEEPPAASEPTQTGRKMDTTPAAASPAASTGATAPAASARTSPKARRLAREHGIDLSAIHGSGPGGEIVAEDIERAAGVASPPDQPAVDQGAMTSIGRIMADRTTDSWTRVPHFFVSRDVDATALNQRRESLVTEIERTHRVRVTHTDLLVAAVARALREHPRMNARWNPGGSIGLNEEVNVALAIAVENAVVTAVIRHADRASVGEIALRRKELADRARANRLQPADIAGATFTISNLGMLNVDAFTAIIVPPQAGILAVGAITDRVVAIDGLVNVRPMLTLTLSADHRVVDGVRAAMFLNTVVHNLAES